MNRLESKVALVTGAGAGIGAATAAAFLREGAKVVLADIDLAAAERQAGQLGVGTIPVAADIGDEASIEAMIAAAVSAFGQLDVLFNNAAATGLAATQDGPVETMSTAVWDDTMRINLRGTMLAIRAALPHMTRGGGGSIVNVCSNSMLGGDLGNTAYAVSKAGIATLTLYVAAQHGRAGIRCNAISPGFIETKPPQSERSLMFRRVIHDHELTSRGGTPEDIAMMAIYLASDESTFVNGQVLQVDGGALAHQAHYADALKARGA